MLCGSSYRLPRPTAGLWGLLAGCSFAVGVQAGEAPARPEAIEAHANGPDTAELASSKVAMPPPVLATSSDDRMTASTAPHELGDAEPARADVAPLTVLAEDDLQSLHAGASIVTGNQTVTGSVSGNVINGDYTAGSVTLSGDALGGFEGLGNIAINTGAQVTIQSSMNVIINVSE